MDTRTLTTEKSVESLTPVEACRAEIERLHYDAGRFGELLLQTQSSNGHSFCNEAINRLYKEAERLRRKILPVLQAGYCEYTPPSDWFQGFVEDSRQYKQADWLGWGWLGSMALLVLGRILRPISGTPLISGDSCVAGVVLLTIVGFIGVFYLEVTNAQNLQAAGLPSEENLLFLKRPLPPEALAAYQTAQSSRLFERIEVYAPDKEAFYKVRDPIICGRVGDRTFFIAQFVG